MSELSTENSIDSAGQRSFGFVGKEVEVVRTAVKDNEEVTVERLAGEEEIGAELTIFLY